MPIIRFLSTSPTVQFNAADRLARFQREAQILASLNHSNIAAIRRQRHKRRTGIRLGPYEIAAPLGAGGMASQVSVLLESAQAGFRAVAVAVDGKEPFADLP